MFPALVLTQALNIGYHNPPPPSRSLSLEDLLVSDEPESPLLRKSTRVPSLVLPRQLQHDSWLGFQPLVLALMPEAPHLNPGEDTSDSEVLVQGSASHSPESIYR